MRSLSIQAIRELNTYIHNGVRMRKKQLIVSFQVFNKKPFSQADIIDSHYNALKIEIYYVYK